jgi:hypothetical protein
MTRFLLPRLTPDRPESVVRRHLYSSLSIIVLLVLGSACARPQSLLIQHVTVIDATGRAPQPNTNVIVQGDRITSVSPRKKAHVPKTP